MLTKINLLEKNKIQEKRKIIKAKPITPLERITIRFLIICGTALILFFLGWFFVSVRVGNPYLYWLLTAAFLFKIGSILYEWYQYFSISIPPKPASEREWKVDILTTACPGEPYSMIITTLQACQEITYPHQTYLCDEGNDPYLKQVCSDLGVIHVTRTDKTDAKAGNINNALRQATGEICVVLDPDHVPVPDFLDQVLPYFQDPDIGFVQIVQAYGNQLQNNVIAKAAAQQTYSFYGPMMMGMNTYGTAQAIGANCTFRREALDSIGGHAVGLAEDMHTSMQLHAKGWKSVYVPEILARGLVPSTLSAYYKQQLKWARGTFELLFVTYFRLIKNFTWRQRLHYLLVPMYYLYGLFGLIDIAIPVVSLTTSEVPWRVDVGDFFLYFTPIFALSLLIRQYAQRWYLEEHERGFHIMGGILRTGTWWIYLMGFVYSIFRIRVPYIPTPKDDELENAWVLSLPNVLVCLISIGAAWYGLQIDWNEYTLFMAGFALTNAGILGVTVLVGQQKLLASLYRKLTALSIFHYHFLPLRGVYWRKSHQLFRLLRHGVVVYGILAGLLLSSYLLLSQEKPGTTLKALEPSGEKNTGGFYTGMYLPDVEKTQNLTSFKNLEKSTGHPFHIVSFYQFWGPQSLENFPDTLFRQIYQNQSVPMLTWEPFTYTFPQIANHPEFKNQRKTCKAINEGYFDAYIRAYAERIRSLKKPIFIRFAHEPDNPVYPWSPAYGNTPEEYRKAWIRVVSMFWEVGAKNVTWVWNPWKNTTIHDYYPGDAYVDWLSVTALNYGQAAYDGKWQSFQELYAPFRQDLNDLKKPVMLAEFGSTHYGGEQETWLKHALEYVKDSLPEVKSLVFFYSNQDRYWVTSWRPNEKAEFIDWTFEHPQAAFSQIKQSFQALNEKKSFASFSHDHQPGTTPNYQSHFVKSSQGKFQLLVDDKPFYIQGVSYNPGHDWRDGGYLLNRRHLLDDFQAIKEMGANTIRRYEPSEYDDNLLNIAHEKNLKVLYGFWFDPKIDYHQDSVQVNQYFERTIQLVEKYKDSPAILGWTIGNETWGILKHHYAQPYLFQVRAAYVNMLERLAKRIHEIDPQHPVFTVAEHSPQLNFEITSLRENAPSIDVIGVNSYYHQQISQLSELMETHNPGRPYLISEFGPKGYWMPAYSSYTPDSLLAEDSDYQKAMWYAYQWNHYVKGKRDNNIGGIAFCWRDRLEGSATWFGLTDMEDRRKPAYYALRKQWTQQAPPATLHDVFIQKPAGAIEKGKTYTFKAITENNIQKDLRYEWYLCRESYLERKGRIKVLSGGMEAKITLPNEPSLYRLYLHISDANNNVVTASEPIQVN